MRKLILSHAAPTLIFCILAVGCSGSSEVANEPKATDSNRDVEQASLSPEEIAEAQLGFPEVSAEVQSEAIKSTKDPESDGVGLIAKPQHDFVGAKVCSMCHRTPKHGEQHPIWEASPHARAIETLGTPRAKALAAAWGIDDPQKSGRCLRCHSTAYWFSEERVSDDIAVEEGVSCETCHGPGRDFIKVSVMRNWGAAVAAGLIIPDERTCRQCHNEEGPAVKEFHFEEAWDKIKHPIPE